MAKFYGKIGYAKTVETAPGVWVEQITERNYYGEEIRNTRQLQSADQVNNNIKIVNKFSIVADPYAMDNFRDIRYLEFMGTKWTVNTVEVERPRLILEAGGVWNGQQT